VAAGIGWGPRQDSTIRVRSVVANSFATGHFPAVCVFCRGTDVELGAAPASVCVLGGATAMAATSAAVIETFGAKWSPAANWVVVVPTRWPTPATASTGLGASAAPLPPNTPPKASTAHG
jgi:hypothetical protein